MVDEQPPDSTVVRTLGPDPRRRRLRLTGRLTVAAGWAGSGAWLLPWTAGVIADRVTDATAGPGWAVTQGAVAVAAAWAVAARPVLGRLLDATSSARDVVRAGPAGVEVTRERRLLGVRLTRRFREGPGSAQVLAEVTRLGTPAQRGELAADVRRLVDVRTAAGTPGTGLPRLPADWYGEVTDAGAVLVLPQPGRWARVPRPVLTVTATGVVCAPLVLSVAHGPGWAAAAALSVLTCLASTTEFAAPSPPMPPWQRVLVVTSDAVRTERTRGGRTPPSPRTSFTVAALLHVGGDTYQLRLSDAVTLPVPVPDRVTGQGLVDWLIGHPGIRDAGDPPAGPAPLDRAGEPEPGPRPGPPVPAWGTSPPAAPALPTRPAWRGPRRDRQDPLTVLLVPPPLRGTRVENGAGAFRRQLQAQLAAGRLALAEVRLLDLDLAGGGGLVMATDRRPLTLQRLALGIEQALLAQQAADPQRPLVLVSLGLTGGVSADVAGRRPDLLDGLVLIHPLVDYRRRVLGIDPGTLRTAGRHQAFGAALRAELAQEDPDGPGRGRDGRQFTFTAATLLVPGTADTLSPVEEVPDLAPVTALSEHVHALGDGSTVLDTVSYLDPAALPWRTAVVDAVRDHVQRLRAEQRGG